MAGLHEESDEIVFCDGLRFATVDSDRDVIILRDVATGEKLAELERHKIENERIAFAPDHKTAITQGRDKTIRVWDTATGEERLRVSGHNNQAYFFGRYSPDGKTLAMASEYGVVRLWELATGTQRATFQLDSRPMQLAFSPDGKTLASLNRLHTFQLWDVSPGREPACLKTDRPAPWQVLVFSPDGRTIAVGDYDGTLEFRDATTGDVRAGYHLDFGLAHLAFSPDGQTLVACYNERNMLANEIHGRTDLPWVDRLLPDHRATVLLDAATGRGLTRLPACRRADFLPDGKTVVTYSYDDAAIRLWDMPPQRAVRPIVAWAALCGAVGQSGVWWYLRRKWRAACVGRRGG